MLTCLPNVSEFQDFGNLQKTFLTSRRTTVSIVRQLSPDITRFFTEHCPISSANIQACMGLKKKKNIVNIFLYTIAISLIFKSQNWIRRSKLSEIRGCNLIFVVKKKMIISHNCIYLIKGKILGSLVTKLQLLIKTKINE